MGRSTAQRVQKHRASLREQGLRPVQLWVPDVRNAGFREECNRQSRLVSNDPLESEVLAWGELVAERSEWS